MGTAPDRTAETAAEIRVSGRLSGPLAGANAVDWAEWRDAGGVFETDEIAIAWADLRVSGSGGWTLDKALRPAGADGQAWHGRSKYHAKATDVSQSERTTP